MNIISIHAPLYGMRPQNIALICLILPVLSGRVSGCGQISACFNPRSAVSGVRHINVPSITGTTRFLFSGADCPLVGGGYRFAPPATFA